MQPTQEVIKLTPQTNEALKKLKVECPICKGADIRNKVIESCCCDNGKVKWTWQPKVGQWCIYNSETQIKKEWQNLLGLIYSIENGFLDIISKDKDFTDAIKFFIPILSWETIKEILEGLGYEIKMGKQSHKNFHIHGASIWKGVSCLSIGDGKTRQLAVMKAVIALSREVNNG